MGWIPRAEAHATNTEHQFGDGEARKHPSAYANGSAAERLSELH